MTRSVGLRSLAVQYPRGLRTNQFFRNHQAAVVAAAEDKKKARPIFGAASDSAKDQDDFDREMQRYLQDPFRGTVERRVLTEGESALSLELTAARRALSAAAMTPKDVDVMIVASFLPDTFGAMNASYLARELEIEGQAFNIESACAGAMVGFNLGSALVASGQHKNALVVTSCTYSRDTDTQDPISWTVGDGAGAFVISGVEPGYGRLGGKSVHTGRTCGSLWFQNYQRADGSLWFRLQGSASAGKNLRDTAEAYLVQCCHGALADAGVKLSQIDAFVFNTPLAWYAKFCARTLGIDSARVIDTYPRFANMGPALFPSNLYFGARELPIREGDLVLCYSIGSISSAGAVVMRWGKVALGSEPEPASIICD